MGRPASSTFLTSYLSLTALPMIMVAAEPARPPPTFNLTSIEAALESTAPIFKKEIMPAEHSLMYRMQIASVKFGLVGDGADCNTAHSL
jgi:hypothetical protein